MPGLPKSTSNFLRIRRLQPAGVWASKMVICELSAVRPYIFARIITVGTEKAPEHPVPGLWYSGLNVSHHEWGKQHQHIDSSSRSSRACACDRVTRSPADGCIPIPGFKLYDLMHFSSVIRRALPLNPEWGRVALAEEVFFNRRHEDSFLNRRRYELALTRFGIHEVVILMTHCE
jgi:hypothetical protein